MKPEAAWSDLDLAAQEVATEMGFEFLGAEFPFPHECRYRYVWHYRIEGKHAKAGLWVTQEMLDDTICMPGIVKHEVTRAIRDMLRRTPA